MAQAVSGAAERLGRDMHHPVRGAVAFQAHGAGRSTAPLQQQVTTLVVPTMHCGGCLRKVEAALSGLDGVTDARANLSTRRVLVHHDATTVDPSQLVAALADTGFKSNELIADDAQSNTATDADRDYLKRLAVAGFSAANIMLLSVSVWSGAGGDMPLSVQALFHWVSAMIAVPAVAYAGQPFFRSALAALGARRVNMDVPISLGVTLATAMSLYQTIRGSEQVYFDAAVTLLFFLLIGRALDARMRHRAAGAAANLLGLRATTATVVHTDGTTERVSARGLQPGLMLLTAAGERFAADSRIAAGETEVDDSLITGETRPRTAKVGDTVYAGTINLAQPVTGEALATGEATLMAEIARLLSAAEQGRARYVRLADRAARLYAPAVHALGLGTFVGWLAMGHGWEAALTAAIAVLIITCPCALALAVPAVQVAATSRLFGKGILVKAPDGLERITECDTVVFDKTGTLTLGEPRIASSGGEQVEVPDDVLARAASLAVVSRHPYAKAVVAAAHERGLSIRKPDGIEEVAGCGLRRQTAGGEERLGSARWCGVSQSEGTLASLWHRRGSTPAVAIPLEDVIRPDAAKVVDVLERAGLPVTLLSGDRESEVERMAKLAGIERYVAGCLPAEKVRRLEALRAQGRKVLMVGDGLNDAPALAAAHASLSPSTAADISQTASDAVFQGERLAAVLEAIAISRISSRMSLENFAIAIGYNMIFVPLAVLGLVTPLIAAIAMSASSIAVTANALRLRSRRLTLGNWRSTS